MKYFLILGGILAVSCSDIKPQKTSAYFSLDSLIDNQISLLIEKEAHLSKQAIANSDSADNQFTPDSLGWANEFQIIRDLDINKPALIGRYNISLSEDVNSNLSVIEYKAKSAELEVQLLEIFYLEKPSEIKLIKAKALESNSIFNSKKELEMRFNLINQELILSEYRIYGHQKMILQDSIVFDVRGEINN